MYVNRIQTYIFSNNTYNIALEHLFYPVTLKSDTFQMTLQGLVYFSFIIIEH